MRVAFTVEQCWHEVPGGTAVATLRLARELMSTDGLDLIFVAGRHRTPPADQFAPPGPVRMLPLARPWLYEAWLRMGWPRVEAATGPVDLVHASAGVPAGTTAPQVVTLHDVAFLRRPDRLTRHGARLLTRAVEVARRAEMVCCPSETVRRDLIGHGFVEDRVTVVPWGVDPIDVTPDEIAAIRNSLALPDRFVLALATLEPRKNLHRLIDAMGRLDESVPLVVAGAEGWGGVGEDLRQLSTAADIRFLGHVEGSVLPHLIAAAEVLAYPSEEEGFGLPVLEAMSIGTAVVTSRGTATEDVAGSAAVLVNPFDVDSIAAGITEGLARSAELAAQGRVQARGYSWRRSADVTLEVYRQVSG